MKRSKVRLLYLIVALAILSGVVAFATALGSAYVVQREHLLAQSLSANQAYAAKFAEAIDLYVEAVQRRLEASAKHLPALMDRPLALQAEAIRLAEQSDDETVAAIADRHDKILAFDSRAPALSSNPATLADLALGDTRQKNNVSAAYRSSNANMAVAFTQPIIGANNENLGMVGIATFMCHDNALSRLIGNHFLLDGSYAYVVDKAGVVIAHQDLMRVGESERGNAAVEALLRKEHGALRITNTHGERFLAGYAPMAAADWGVVVLSPEAIISAPQRSLLRRTALYSLPIALISIISVCALAYWIAHPLGKLANSLRSTNLADPKLVCGTERNWYFEAQQLGEAVDITLAQYRQRLSSLDAETLTDPMTDLLNRRGLAREIDRLQALAQPFAVLALDLDRFKRVNDSFGHAAGDEVLKTFAAVTRRTIRPDDTPCRVGGEEFLVLMPGSDLRAAQALAERLRATIQETVMPGGVGHITVSIGVALWPAHDADVQVVMALADQALYQAKKEGRNRVTTHTRLDPA